MIVLRLRSGLGNQMSQYANFLQMQKWYGKENVKLDIDTYHWKAHNGRELEKVFGIDLRKDAAPVSLSLQMADVGYSLKNRILRRLRGKKHCCYVHSRNLTYEDYQNLPDHIYIEGGWGEEHYFCEVAEQVRSVFQFHEAEDDTNKMYLSRISNSCSVGVHVRRGDYKKYPNSFPMCPVEYYRKAADFIRKGNPGEDISFFVFSDEIDWCRKNLFFLENVQFVCHNVNTDSYKDMMLLSACKHQIMANSTFSWWASWLNPNPDKMVLYPSTKAYTASVMPKSWICVNF